MAMLAERTEAGMDEMLGARPARLQGNDPALLRRLPDLFESIFWESSRMVSETVVVVLQTGREATQLA